MKEIHLKSDLHLICVRAKSFPEGIEDAFKTLSEKLPSQMSKGCYGIFENKQEIIYRAGVLKEDEDENVESEMEMFTVPKGKYLGVSIHDWKSNIPKIGQTFDKLYENTRVSKDSPSIEVYVGNIDVLCMVKIASQD